MIKFNFQSKEYEISKEDLIYFENEEIEDFNIDKVLDILNEGKEKAYFDYEYYSDNCEKCDKVEAVDKKYYKFIECHFYVFTKESKYIISSLSKEYESTSFVKLLKEKKVDNSYIVTLVVCEECSGFYVEIEQCEM